MSKKTARLNDKQFKDLAHKIGKKSFKFICDNIDLNLKKLTRKKNIEISVIEYISIIIYIMNQIDINIINRTKMIAEKEFKVLIDNKALIKTYTHSLSVLSHDEKINRTIN